MKAKLLQIIEQKVCEALGISYDYYLTNHNSRRREIVTIRQLTILLARKTSPHLMPYQFIGGCLGLHHSTVIYHERVGAGLVETDKSLAACTNVARKKIAEAIANLINN